MTEPAEVADRADVVVEGVWTWAVSNSNIGGARYSTHVRQLLDGLP